MNLNHLLLDIKSQTVSFYHQRLAVCAKICKPQIQLLKKLEFQASLNLEFALFQNSCYLLNVLLHLSSFVNLFQIKT